jgi:ABC-type uncharacterized transport system auxiliary subunit
MIWMVLSISGCSNISVQRMIPDTKHEKFVKGHETIRIGAVRGGEIKTKTAVRDLTHSDEITPELFSEALYQALEISKIFSQVKRSGETALLIEADLFSQEIRVKWPMTATLLVRYRLIDSDNGSTIWEKSIASVGKSPVSEMFEGARVLAIERAVKENLNKLLAELSSVFKDIKKEGGRPNEQGAKSKEQGA